MKLIDKSAVVAEIEKLKVHSEEAIQEFGREGYTDNVLFEQSKIRICETLLSFLDTLEVRDTDLDIQTFAKEMDTVFALPSSETKNTEEEPLNWEYAIAKHFFELGLKAKVK